MQISLISDVAENLNLSMHVISICVTEFIHDCKKQKEDRGSLCKRRHIYTSRSGVHCFETLEQRCRHESGILNVFFVNSCNCPSACFWNFLADQELC